MSIKYQLMYQFSHAKIFSTNHYANLLLLDDPSRVRSQITSVLCPKTLVLCPKTRLSSLRVESGTCFHMYNVQPWLGGASCTRPLRPRCRYTVVHLVGMARHPRSRRQKPRQAKLAGLRASASPSSNPATPLSSALSLGGLVPLSHM